MRNNNASIPKIQIESIVSGVVTEILSETDMITIRDGEYYYVWSVPENLSGRVKVKYKAEFNSKYFYDFEFIDILKRQSDLLNIDEFRTMHYNSNATVSYVDIKYGSKMNPIAEYRINFTYDNSNRVVDMDIERV